MSQPQPVIRMSTIDFHHHLVFMRFLGYEWSEISKVTGRTPRTCAWNHSTKCMTLRQQFQARITELLVKAKLEAMLKGDKQPPDYQALLKRAIEETSTGGRRPLVDPLPPRQGTTVAPGAGSAGTPRTLNTRTR